LKEIAKRGKALVSCQTDLAIRSIDIISYVGRYYELSVKDLLHLLENTFDRKSVYANPSSYPNPNSKPNTNVNPNSNPTAQ